jgi:hypothetical protein
MNNEHVNKSAGVIYVNDQCTSHVTDQSTKLSMNNLSFIEVSTNEDFSLLINIQVPDPHEN